MQHFGDPLVQLIPDSDSAEDFPPLGSRGTRFVSDLFHLLRPDVGLPLLAQTVLHGARMFRATGPTRISSRKVTKLIEC